MNFEFAYEDKSAGIIALYEEAFTASEGSEEGRVIAGLARDLLMQTPPDDLFVFTAMEDGALLGCIMFTRLTYAEDERVVFLLSPVAVRPAAQRKGVGEALISHGLDSLRRSGVDVAITYGDPSYYARVGFDCITEEVAAAPLPITQPEGWLAQSLTKKPLDPLRGAASCVAALNSPDYW